MNISLLMITIVLFCICVGSVIKIYVMKKSIKEIESIYKYILNSDTNNVITITSNDKDIKKNIKNKKYMSREYSEEFLNSLYANVDENL